MLFLFGNELVGQLLDFIGGASFIVLTDFLVLQQFLQMGNGIATNIAYGDFTVFSFTSHQFDKLLAPLLS